MKIEAAAWALFIGYFLNLVIGDPWFLLKPSTWLRWLTFTLEKKIRRFFPKGRKGERIGGTVVAILVIIIGMLPVVFVLFISYRIHYWFGLAVETFIAYSMIGAKGVKDRSMQVMDMLDEDVEPGELRSLSRFIGYEASYLNREGKIQAVIARIAELVPERVIGPVFYMAWGGALFGYLYKIISSMDSAIGYRNERYRYFGTAAAIMDDVMNYLPARISAGFMIASSWLLQLDTKNAVYIFKRDRYQHTSPNTAQTQSVMAGALDIQLPGTIAHTEGPLPGPEIGDELRNADENDLVRANQMLYTTSTVCVLLLCGLRFLTAYLWELYI